MHMYVYKVCAGVFVCCVRVLCVFVVVIKYLSSHVFFFFVSWKAVLEGALLEARAGNLPTARRVFKFLIDSMPWNGPVYQEACHLEVSVCLCVHMNVLFCVLCIFSLFSSSFSIVIKNKSVVCVFSFSFSSSFNVYGCIFLFSSFPQYPCSF